MSLISHFELARINFCPPRTSTGKWVVLRRELGRNAVDEKLAAEGIGVGYREDLRWGGGGDFVKPPELYCICCFWYTAVESLSTASEIVLLVLRTHTA